ncbi:MAG: asparagine synthase-related protein [Armatimonadota bacterium]|nr:asparagine synthase-related protein [Armatimonadota bacterium]MDR7532008.1 asparagine synthase-related protein [Armatimonadota bacterium]MDR7535939.1 asparagine synthase-related protein [Armatimonadota bacterium]
MAADVGIRSSLAAGLIAEIREVTAGKPVVVAFSGGLDSSTVAALAREALGAPSVLLVTVNMGPYSYRRGNQIVLEMAAQLGLQQRCLLGQKLQHVVQRAGPACNRCTREIKLGLVQAAARGRLVLTGSNRSDTWGQRGLRLHGGFYAPLLDLEKPQIRALADELGLRIPRIGEAPGREGCKLKHLLKPLVNPDYHGRAVAEANEVLLRTLAEAGWSAELANVKIIGPLRRNVALVNIRPAPPDPVRAAVEAALSALAVLDEVRMVEGPLRLVVRAGPALAGDARGRRWIEQGRLAPEFAHPITVEWRLGDGRLATFHVLDATPA